MGRPSKSTVWLIVPIHLLPRVQLLVRGEPKRMKVRRLAEVFYLQCDIDFAVKAAMTFTPALSWVTENPTGARIANELTKWMEQMRIGVNNSVRSEEIDELRQEAISAAYQVFRLSELLKGQKGIAHDNVRYAEGVMKLQFERAG